MPTDVVLEGEFVLACSFKCVRQVTPFAHASDGCTDVIAISARSRPSLAALALRAACMHYLRPGSHLQLEDFNFYKASEVIISPASDQDTLNVDGEVGEGVETRIKTVPSAAVIFSCHPLASVKS